MNPDFLAGVIEGFYGQPWSQAERFELFDWMRDWGLNTYLYAPKDDLKHRVLWRERYSESEAIALREVIQRCRAANLRFIHALGPGLDIRYSNIADIETIKSRFQQLISLGVESFALLFDDIPDRMDGADAARFKTFAAAQAHVTNEIFRWLRAQIPDARFLFCPTPYCGRMAQRHLGGPNYLETIGRELVRDIDIFWTGPEIISQEISVEHIREIAKLLRRKPLIWDNLHANDYDVRRFYAGPYCGRSRDILAEVAGILTNPNCEFALNYAPVRTFADFLSNSGIWQPRESYLAALREWLPKFEGISFDDLVLLCDCFYLPHLDGAEATSLFDSLREVLDCARLAAAFPFLSKATRLRETCARIAELRDRRLFYALSRRTWELREELDLIEKFIAFHSNPKNANKPFTSDFHLQNTYRGGFVPRLQKLLTQNADGSFSATPSHE